MLRTGFGRTFAFLVGHILVAAGMLAYPPSAGARPFDPPATTKGRYLAFVSDTHMSLGKVNGKWHPFEDFRWPVAFKGLLDELNIRGNGKVDLVFIGDVLEMWQLPADIACNGSTADLGCSISESVELTRRITTAHKTSFDELARFSQKADNRLYIIPGNHDAALVLPKVWSVLATALMADSGRVKLVETGIWSSADGKIVVEHGHQIGADVNKYENWPKILGSSDRIIRPWGELFVQRLFNDTEEHYPIIDNLSPESKGALLRMQDRGVWRSVNDFARLIMFNLFETSWSQLRAALGKGEEKSGDWTKDDLQRGRDLGHELVAYAFAKGHPTRDLLLTGKGPKADALRKEFGQITKSLPDFKIATLCDHMALASKKDVSCKLQTTGAIVEYLTQSGSRVMGAHLFERYKTFSNMKLFLYGHTHEYETGHDVALVDNSSGRGQRLNTKVKVFNSGAFQRLIDFESYKVVLNRKFPGVSLSEGLSKLTPGDLAPCYTVIHGPYHETDGAHLRTQIWKQSETGPGAMIGASEHAIFCTAQ